MHTRVVNFAGAKDIDAGIRLLQDKVLPAMKNQKGYRGLTASADRAGGLLGVLSLWDTAEDREASDSVLAPFRQRAAEVIGGEMKIENYQLLMSEVTGTAATRFGSDGHADQHGPRKGRREPGVFQERRCATDQGVRRVSGTPQHDEPRDR